MRWLRRLSVAVAGLAPMSAHCSSSVSVGDVSSAVSGGSMEVEVLVTGRGIDMIARTVQPRSWPLHVADGGPQLSWRYTGTHGAVIASGKAADPRFIRFEFAKPGSPDSGLAGAGLLRVSVPNVEGDLTIAGAGELGRVHVPAAANEPEPKLIDLSRDVVGEPRKIVDHGESRANVNLLILPEGYQASELDAFHRHAGDVASRLGSLPDYGAHWSQINIWTQDITSRDSGTSDPQTGADKTTAFEVTFGDDRVYPRRLLFPQASAATDVYRAVDALAERLRADMVILLVNTEEYGGAGGSFATVSRTVLATEILAHELGHSLFNLGDEYAGGGVSCDPASIFGANLASSIDRLPWQDLLTTTQLPTPTTSPDGTVGAFEGGGYCTTGVFRPEKNCLMRQLGLPMCRVCRREMDRIFAQRAR